MWLWCGGLLWLIDCFVWRWCGLGWLVLLFGWWFCGFFWCYRLGFWLVWWWFWCYVIDSLVLRLVISGLFGSGWFVVCCDRGLLYCLDLWYWWLWIVGKRGLVWWFYFGLRVLVCCWFLVCVGWWILYWCGWCCIC